MASGNEQSIAVTKAKDYRENYANNVQVYARLWDIRLIFGLVRSSETEGERGIGVEIFQTVYLSPQAAKTFADVLRQNIEAYERAFGEIKTEREDERQSLDMSVVN